MLGMVIRFIVSAIVLMVVSLLVPGFAVAGFFSALIAAVVIALLGYAVERVIGKDVSPRSRGWVGFFTSAAVIFLAQFFVPGMRVNIIGALLAALVIGLIDAVVPTTLR